MSRHGARLDAADSNWHQTASAPHDPPLTYGGWNQASLLGAEIATLARLLADHSPCESDLNASAEPTGSPEIDPVAEKRRKAGNRRRKHRIVFHSSPFERCIQTAIAASAGINYDPRLTSHHSTRFGRYVLRHGPPTSPSSPYLPEPDGGPLSRLHTSIRRCLLRIDPFLGEWLSSSYFAGMPPPDPVNMTAAAMNELLRPSAPIEAGFVHAGISQRRASHFNHIAAFDDMTLEEVSPRHRSGSCPVGHSNCEMSNDSISGYIPPTPKYPVSSTDPIPPGYVSHARDTCVQVDHFWDSADEPLDWGDGGKYPEEWRKAHDRYCRGLHRMFHWYENEDDDVENDADTILVLVSHGAGCHALINSLTGRPLFMDVPMASLTLAVRKPAPGPGRTRQEIGPAADGCGFRELRHQYDIKLTASTAHLSYGANVNSLVQRAHSTSAVRRCRHRLSISAADTIKPQQVQAPSPGSEPSLSRSSSISSVGSGLSNGLWTPAVGRARSQTAASGPVTATTPISASGLAAVNGINGVQASTQASVPPCLSSSSGSSPGPDTGTKSQPQASPQSTGSWGGRGPSHPALSQHGLWGSATLPNRRR